MSGRWVLVRSAASGGFWLLLGIREAVPDDQREASPFWSLFAFALVYVVARAIIATRSTAPACARCGHACVVCQARADGHAGKTVGVAIPPEKKSEE